jgi:hypothetical protein
VEAGVAKHFRDVARRRLQHPGAATGARIRHVQEVFSAPAITTAADEEHFPAAATREETFTAEVHFSTPATSVRRSSEVHLSSPTNSSTAQTKQPAISVHGVVLHDGFPSDHQGESDAVLATTSRTSSMVAIASNSALNLNFLQQ